MVILGVQLRLGSKTLTSERDQALQEVKPPTTVTQILSVLGLMGFFHHWFPNFDMTAKPLYQAASETPMGPLTHQAIIHNNLSLLKNALLRAPCPSLPDPMRHYYTFIQMKV